MYHGSESSLSTRSVRTSSELEVGLTSDTVRLVGVCEEVGSVDSVRESVSVKTTTGVRFSDVTPISFCLRGMV